MIVGVDFDNTIVSYDRVLYAVAVERGLVAASIVATKPAVRETVRRLPDGELRWQELQARAYGPGISAAEPMPGVKAFFQRCRLEGVPVYIVSHKTRLAARGDGITDLRAAALQWMATHGFFLAEGLGLTREQVFFEDSRDAKILRINYLGCSHFIDDLEETFLESSFPNGVRKILLAPADPRSQADCLRLDSWRAIEGYLFPESRHG
ncbi:MAG TPA: hypothetical protein PLO37_02005 [Candidatus Hydrogenedentes bacterium]|nr:hypothetical protein [Candidatus Hydrogenedentota bacterium]HPG65591.1 hypothetical protein [Candidatus Hydrogenedentota bacterium]